MLGVEMSGPSVGIPIGINSSPTERTPLLGSGTGRSPGDPSRVKRNPFELCFDGISSCSNVATFICCNEKMAFCCTMSLIAILCCSHPSENNPVRASSITQTPTPSPLFTPSVYYTPSTSFLYAEASSLRRRTTHQPMQQHM